MFLFSKQRYDFKLMNIFFFYKIVCTYLINKINNRPIAPSLKTNNIYYLYIALISILIYNSKLN